MWKIPGFTGSFIGNVTITGTLTATALVATIGVTAQAVTATSVLNAAAAQVTGILGIGAGIAYPYLSQSGGAGSGVLRFNGTGLQIDGSGGGLAICAATGDLRFRGGNTTQAAFRNNANNIDVLLFRTDSSDNFTLGDPSSLTRLKLAAATAVQIAMATPVLELGTGTLSATGSIRHANATTMVAARNAASTADIAILATDATNNVTLGDAANAARVKIAGATAVQIAMSTPVLEIGTTNTSGVGDVRFQAATARVLLGLRNNGNTADISAVATDTSGNLWFGSDNANGNQATALIFNQASAGNMLFRSNNTTKLTISGSANTLNNTTVDIQSGGTSRIKTDGTGIGFFATAPATKQTVTGSRGANAALASLLTALATYGIVTDSSSA